MIKKKQKKKVSPRYWQIYIYIYYVYIYTQIVTYNLASMCCQFSIDAGMGPSFRGTAQASKMAVWDHDV